MGEILTLRDLLTEKTYQVPTYKRMYCWDEEQSMKMWHDIFRIISKIHKESNLYMGTLIHLDNGEDGNIELIDGQHRLVTLSLFLGIIRSILLNDSESNGWVDVLKQYLFTNENDGRIRLNNERDNNFYLRLLKEGSEMNETECRCSGSLAMWKIYKKHYALINIEKRERCRDLYDVILDKLYFTVYKVNDSYEARKALETINETGKKPTNFEMLRCCLLNWIDSNITDNIEKTMLELKIDEIWNSAEEYAFNGELKREDLDTFLNYYWDVEKGRIVKDSIKKYRKKLNRANLERNIDGYLELRLLLCAMKGSDTEDILLDVLGKLKTRLDSFCVGIARSRMLK